MFKHILVPLDLAAKSGRALTLARRLAELSRARVSLLHVVQEIDNLAGSEVREIYRRFEKSARQKITPMVGKAFRGSDLAVSLDVLVGVPAREIVRFAQSRRVDLIVMPSHKVVPRDPARGFGTTSYKVGILCRCPILLVK
ncbi:MAG: universal stress protein [Planctomycetota bacterium]